MIAELFVREIREGIDDTGVKAAFLKCAVEQHGIVGDVPRILAAIAAAARRDRRAHDGAHQRPGADRAAGARDPDERGRRPGAIVIAHAGDSNDLDYLRAIADTRREPRLRPLQHRALQPRREPHRDARRARSPRATPSACTSATTRACFYDFMHANPFFADEKPDYLHISNEILPALLAAGVTQEQIDQMLVANPRAFFSAVSARPVSSTTLGHNERPAEFPRGRELPNPAGTCTGAMADETEEKRKKDRRFADEALIWLPDVTRFALSLTGEESDADDLIQETFLRAYQAWNTYVAGTECRG